MQLDSLSCHLEALRNTHILTKHRLVFLALSQEMHIVRAGASCSIGANTRDLIIGCILTELPLLANTNTKRGCWVFSHKRLEGFGYLMK